MSDKTIDPIYMPFSPEEMRRHFVNQAEKHVAYYTKSADLYHRFMDDPAADGGQTIGKARKPRQIEKDERFWVATSLKNIYDGPTRVGDLTRLLSEAYGPTPPVEGLSTWWECLSGDLQLYFEACLPAPASYLAWLGEHLESRQLTPYVLDAADRNERKRLEGPTHVDALLLNPHNGFSLLVEGKVTSDISSSVTFDDYRNQIARNIDVMLDKNPRIGEPLNRRDPERSLFALLTPRGFQFKPKTRLYGWVMDEYQTSPETLARDLPHRNGVDWVDVSRRLGWISYHDINSILPGACPWLGERLTVRAA
jgi:hypothetical protein